MSLENVALARRWFDEVWNQRRGDLIDVLNDPESVGHLEGGDVITPQQFRDHVHGAFLAIFPDLEIIIEDTVSEGENVVVRWCASGTHQGDGFGLKATHRQVSFRGMTWMRCRDGRIAEAWDCWNQGGLFDRLRAPTGEVVV
ncbi:MAG: ester cyclase [Isosphaeraceae bacterium]